MAWLSLAVGAWAPAALGYRELVTQYIAPVDRPTWDDRVTNTTYGANVPFAFAYEHAGYQANYRLDIGGKSYFAFQDWIRIWGHDAVAYVPSAPTRYYPALLNRSVDETCSAPRRLYPFTKKSLEWYAYYLDASGSVISKERKIDYPRETDKTLESAWVLSSAQLDAFAYAHGLDGSGSYAAYVQNVHTDYVYTVSFAPGGCWIGGVWHAASGHAGAMTPQEVTNSGTVPACGFTASCCAFDHWAVMNAGGTESARYQPGDTIRPTGDLTLTAVWTPHAYKVSFNANGGSGNTMEPQTFQYHEEKALSPNVFSKEGHDFTGWATDEGGPVVYRDREVVSNLTPEASGEIVLYAQWASARYVVTLEDANDPASGDRAGPGELAVTFGEKLDDVAEDCLPTKAGYDFLGYWEYSNGTGKEYITAKGKGNAPWSCAGSSTIYAVWKEKEYVISFDSVLPGVDAPPQNTLAFGEKFGELANLKVDPSKIAFDGTPAKENSFSHWRTARDGGGFEITAVTKMTETCDITLYAAWSFPVSFDANGGSGSHADVQVTTGRRCSTLPGASSFVRRGYALSGWNERPDGSGRGLKTGDTVAFASNCTLYAQWTAGQIDVTFNANDGSAQPKSETLYFDLNQPFGALPVPEEAPKGKFFAGWWTEKDYTKGEQVAATNVAVLAIETLYARWKKSESEYSEPSEEGSGEDWDVFVDHPYYAVSTGGTARVVVNSAWSYGRSLRRLELSNSIASPAGLPDGGDSWLAFTTNGPGVLRFTWYVESERGYVNTNGVYVWCDRLEFSENGAVTRRLQGTNFVEAGVCVTNRTAGQHVFRWRYVKDGSDKYGFDRGMVDAVAWEPLPPEEPCCTVRVGSTEADYYQVVAYHLRGKVYNLPASPIPPPEGKRFVGWQGSDGRRYDDGVLVHDLVPAGDSIVLTPIWE